MSGIASGLTVLGCGSVSWRFYANKGETIDVTIDKAYHVPELPTKSLSPQQACQQHGQGTQFLINKSNETLSMHSDTIVAPYDHLSNLPIVSIEARISKHKKVCNLNHDYQHAELDNLTHNQRQLLR